MKYLNLGCGDRFFESWTNFDFSSNSKYIIPHDLNQPLPCLNDYFDVVYSSHVLEHLNMESARRLLSEKYRVLKPGGCLRVVVPDLEKIARTYLNSLELAILDDCPLNSSNYDWSLIHLIDQFVRTRSGGEMADFWNRDELLNEEFILKTVGNEYLKFKNDKILNSIEKNTQGNNRLVDWLNIKLIVVKNSFLKKLDKKNTDFKELHRIAEFRACGEIHQWMYDRYSLRRNLIELGFKDVVIVDAYKSRITNWEAFNSLDLEDGVVRKPDSLFLEALK